MSETLILLTNLHVKSSHITNGKPIARVNIRQPHAPAHDAGQGGHISDLLDAREEASHLAGPAGIPQLLEHELLKVTVDIKHSLDLHVGLKPFLDPPAVRTDPLKILQLIVITPDNHLTMESEEECK